MGPSSNNQLYELYYIHGGKYVSMFKKILLNIKFRERQIKYKHFIREMDDLVRQGLPDDVIFSKLHHVYHKILPTIRGDAIDDAPTEFDAFVFSRPVNRVQYLENIYATYCIPKYKSSVYLDIGCGDMSITSSMGAMVHADKIYGVDVTQPKSVPDGIIFNHLKDTSIDDDYVLPFSNNNFTIVSAMMSLHHIQNIEPCLEEIKRVIAPGGYLIIREHDCISYELSVVIDLMHAAYAMIFADPTEIDDFRKHFSRYETHQAMLSRISKHGFKHIHSTEPMGHWRHYYSIFECVKPFDVSPNDIQKCIEDTSTKLSMNMSDVVRVLLSTYSDDIVMNETLHGMIS